MKYNKFYIGLIRNGIATNPVLFRPRKSFIYMQFYRIKDEELFGSRLDEAGLSYDYDTRRGSLRVRINQLEDYTKNKELIDEIVALSVANKS